MVQMVQNGGSLIPHLTGGWDFNSTPDNAWPLHERLLRLEQTGNASPELKCRCIGSAMKHRFLTPWRRKPEFTFSADEAVNLPSLADT